MHKPGTIILLMLLIAGILCFSACTAFGYASLEFINDCDHDHTYIIFTGNTPGFENKDVSQLFNIASMETKTETFFSYTAYLVKDWENGSELFRGAVAGGKTDQLRFSTTH